MNFTAKQLFSLTDGRLSTTMDDVYDMLNHIMGTSLMTHHLPVAKDFLVAKNPEWFQKAVEAKEALEKQCPVKSEVSGNPERCSAQFEWLMNFYDKVDNPAIDVPQLINTPEEEKEFGTYMVDHSLLLRKRAN